MKRSQEVQANLAAEFPSFVKLMLQSHVTRGFWLSFPKQFCDLHLPKHDDTVILVDESDEQYKVKYLVEKNGLSGGWRGFAIAHKLLERDVYVVRANGLTDIDGAIALLTLDACVKPMDVDQTEKGMTIYGEEGEKCSESLSVDFHQYNVEENSMFTLSTVAEQPGNDSDEFGSEVLEGIRFSESLVDFKDINSIENFTILVDGLVIDSEIPHIFNPNRLVSFAFDSERVLESKRVERVQAEEEIRTLEAKLLHVQRVDEKSRRGD
ncbi:hypothetical protein Acr_07g0002030 [Actinidia rufa]|uniref:TF-B3 domain-containing protein n=1 Tax=Actinidia rufa TaxID=165716 RepID=A0A7J0EUV3_9ERIC|nr:hypothetical protein Acr_07g0002030 [Actinidia rufa]